MRLSQTLTPYRSCQIRRRSSLTRDQHRCSSGKPLSTFFRRLLRQRTCSRGAFSALATASSSGLDSQRRWVLVGLQRRGLQQQFTSPLCGILTAGFLLCVHLQAAVSAPRRPAAVAVDWAALSIPALPQPPRPSGVSGHARSASVEALPEGYGYGRSAASSLGMIPTLAAADPAVMPEGICLVRATGHTIASDAPIVDADPLSTFRETDFSSALVAYCTPSVKAFATQVRTPILSHARSAEEVCAAHPFAAHINSPHVCCLAVSFCFAVPQVCPRHRSRSVACALSLPAADYSQRCRRVCCHRWRRQGCARGRPRGLSCCRGLRDCSITRAPPHRSAHLPHACP
jgi:hypothetical protein